MDNRWSYFGLILGCDCMIWVFYGSFLVYGWYKSDHKCLWVEIGTFLDNHWSIIGTNFVMDICWSYFGYFLTIG